MCLGVFYKAFNKALGVIKDLNGKDIWEQLVERLQMINSDGTTIFDKPVPSKASALIKSWLDLDVEMSADVQTNSGKYLMILTRWGFAQLFRDPKVIAFLFFSFFVILFNFSIW